jgi:predicted RNA-binding protein YlqC (UPF0109 family)
MADYQRLMQFIIGQVVTKPDKVQLQVKQRPRSVMIKVHLDPEDAGKLIGRGGRHIEAIRTLMRAAALKERRKVFVDIR